MEPQSSSKGPDINYLFKHLHIGLASTKPNYNAPPNSDMSERTPEEPSKKRTETRTRIQYNSSEASSNRTSVNLKFHSRSSSCSEVKPIFKTPKTYSSTVCSFKASPIKSVRKHGRSLSLDLSSVVDSYNIDRKSQELWKIQLHSRTSKAEARRIYWEDLRKDKLNSTICEVEAALSDFQQTRQIELRFKQMQAKAKREELLGQRQWLNVKATENRIAKQLTASQVKQRVQDDCSRSLSYLAANSKAKAELQKKIKLEEAERRKSFQEIIELKRKARAEKAEAEGREHMEKAKRRVDEMFDRTLQENRETLGKLMTAKYARREERA